VIGAIQQRTPFKRGEGVCEPMWTPVDRGGADVGYLQDVLSDG